jgi:tellurite resistance protein TerC
MLLHEILFFIIFLIFIAIILFIDLKVIGKHAHVVSAKEAAIWSAVWIGLSLLFAVFIRYFGEIIHGITDMASLDKVLHEFYPEIKKHGTDYLTNVDFFRQQMSINYLSGYFLEKSLSVDNLFVMMMIFSAFSVRQSQYKTVLEYGIIGAVLMRFIFIFVGAAIINLFDGILLFFGAFLVYSGIKMFIERNKEEKVETKNHPVLKFLSRHFKIYPRYVNERFFIRKEHILYMTPLFIVVIFIEFSDLIFAFDSIPAIFSVTRDPFIVFFSNIFAILGLRSLFFLLVKVVDKFHYLKAGISFLLIFVGIKLLFHTYLEEIGYRSEYSLFVILGILTLSIVVSLLIKKPEKEKKL